MKLVLKGHAYKYAVEQILLMMFPSELPEYGDVGGGSGSAEVSLRLGETFAVAVSVITCGGKTARASARVSRKRLTGKLQADRLLQKIIKLSFYKAAVALTGVRPEWGSLTGIRPSVIAGKIFEQGKAFESVVKTLEREYFVSHRRAFLSAETARFSVAVKNTLAPRDVALYVGIPFCPTRCAYCSFVSHSVEKSMKLIGPFLEALLREIEAAAETAKKLGLSVTSVYIGGGTPTTLSAEELSMLLGRLEESFDLSGIREYTVEAGRADTITTEKLETVKKYGVTRVSVNPQSMSDAVLAAIGRRHSADDVVNAVGLVRRAGLEPLNMDLIAGLPQDTCAGFAASLDRVLSLNPENITVHTLSLKKGSRITLGGTEIPGGAEVAKMLDYAEEVLRSSGYFPYYLYRQKFTSGGFENVGWAQKGHEGYYNVCMMEELCSVLAVGGGGVTKLVSRGSGRIERVFNPKYPYEYIERIGDIIENKRKTEVFYAAEGTENGI